MHLLWSLPARTKELSLAYLYNKMGVVEPGAFDLERLECTLQGSKLTAA